MSTASSGSFFRRMRPRRCRYSRLLAPPPSTIATFASGTSTPSLRTFDVTIAQDIIGLFHRYKDQPQAVWEEAVRAYEGASVDYVLIRRLTKVLTDAATSTPLTTPLPPATLREQVFARGPVFGNPDLFHPATRQEVLQEVADVYGLSTGGLDEMLFADRRASYRLTDAGRTWTRTALLARYNLELARGALYW